MNIKFSKNVVTMLESKDISNRNLKILLEDQFDAFPSEEEEKKEKAKEETEEENSGEVEEENQGETGLPSLGPEAKSDEVQPETPEEKLTPKEKIAALEDRFEEKFGELVNRLDEPEKSPLPTLRNGLTSRKDESKLTLNNILFEKKTLSDQIDALQVHVDRLGDIKDQLDKKTKKFPLSMQNREVFISNVEELADDYVNGRLDVVEILSDQIEQEIDSVFEGDTGFDLEDFKKECINIFLEKTGSEYVKTAPDHIEAVGAVKGAG